MIAPAVIIKTRLVPSLVYLNQLALKYIFDKFHLSAQEERILDEGIQTWVKKVDLNSYQKTELNTIIQCLLLDKKGHFNNEKENYKRADIDYREVYKEGI